LAARFGADLRNKLISHGEVTEKLDHKGGFKTLNLFLNLFPEPKNCAFHARLRSAPAQDELDFDLISDGLPFRRLMYRGPNALSNAIGYATHFSRSHNAVIRVYDESGNVIAIHEYVGEFREW